MTSAFLSTLRNFAHTGTVSMILAGMFALSACSGSDDASDEAAGEAKASALVVLVPVIKHTLNATLSALGSVELAPDAAHDIAVPYEALVQRVLVARGSRVTRGQPLFELRGSDGAHTAPEQARRDAGLAAAEHGRITRLHGQGLATNNELRAAANADANAQAQVAALSSDQPSTGTQTVRAPRDGMIDTLPAQVGAIIPAGGTLARIATADHLLVRIGFEPSDIAGQINNATTYTLIIAPLRAPAQRVSTALSALDQRIDPDSRLVMAVAQLPANSQLLPGDAVRAELTVATHANVPCVPRAAVLYEGDAPYVFVAVSEKGHNVARRRDVKIGFSDNDYVEVRTGLVASDSVVTSGNYELSDAMAIRTAATKAP